MRWRTVAKPEKADGTVARSASIFVCRSCPKGGPEGALRMQFALVSKRSV